MIGKEDCEDFRRVIKQTADALLLKKAEFATGQDPEVIANVTLAYRHLEDASMRLGKAIQAIDGGVSVYARTQVIGA